MQSTTKCARGKKTVGKSFPKKYGITQKTLSKWLKRSATLEDIKNLDIDTAKEIYETNYYTSPRINTLPTEIKEQVFDISVHTGPQRAIKILQEVINLAEFGPVDEDGILGPETRNKAFEAQKEMGPFLPNALVDQRKNFYNLLVANDDSQQVFLKGWETRAEKFRVAI